MIEDYFDNQERKKKTIRSITIGFALALIVAIFLVLFLNRIIPLKQINVTDERIKLNIGDTYNLKYTLFPSNADNPTITFESSNEDIVDVNTEGIIKVKEYTEEEIIITIKSLKYEVSKEVIIDVNRPEYIKNIKFEEKDINIKYGESITLKPAITPQDGYTEGLTWTSSKPDLISVTTDGKITALVNKQDKSVITLTTKEGVSANINVTIVPQKVVIPVNGIKFDKSEISLNYGSTLTLKPIISPNNASNKKINYASSDTNILTIDANGTIKAKTNNNTSATVTATTEDGSYSSKIKVNIKQVDTTIRVNGVSIASPSSILYVNKLRNNTLTLTATVSPPNAKNKDVTWSSSNENVATIDSSGKVTPKGVGETTIKVKTNDGGKTAEYKITVKQKVAMVITSNQGINMTEYINDYTTSDSVYYGQSTKTLRFIYFTNSGFEYHYDKGFSTAKNFLNQDFGSQKKYTDVAIFHTLTDQMIKSLTCDEIKNGTSHKTALSKINANIKTIQELGYNVKGFVISHSPLDDKVATAKNYKIVVGTDKNVCTSGYSSNWKSHLSNSSTKNIISTNKYTYLTYLDVWDNYLKLKSQSDKTFNSVRTFTTPSSKPYEWDKNSTIDFMGFAFKQAGI